jgi:hypothetical protein
MQFRKTENKQNEELKDMKNEDAMYKFLAFSGMLEQNRRKDLAKTKISDKIAFDLHSFEEYYKETLL